MISSSANVSVYAAAIQCTAVSLACMVRWIARDIDLDRVARVIGIELDRPATPEQPS